MFQTDRRNPCIIHPRFFLPCQIHGTVNGSRTHAVNGQLAFIFFTEIQSSLDFFFGAYRHTIFLRSVRRNCTIFIRYRQIRYIAPGSPAGYAAVSYHLYTNQAELSIPHEIRVSGYYCISLLLGSVERRMEIAREMLHNCQSWWLQNIGQYRTVLAHLPNAAIYDLVEDSLFDENLWYTVALYALAMWYPNLTDAQLLQEVAQRTDIVMA